MAAGIFGAAAYLIKTAALPLLAVGPLWLIRRRRYRSAAAPFCAMLPAVAGCMLSAGQNMPGAHDIVSLYYIHYLGYQIYNIGAGVTSPPGCMEEPRRLVFGRCRIV